LIPNQFFEIYGWFALIGSFFFILAQLVMLVDFAHSWAESWIANYEKQDPEVCQTWWYYLLSATGILYLLCVVCTIVMYVVFAKDVAECQTNVWFITINVGLALLVSVLAINPKIQEHNPRSGVLQAAVVCAYGTYLVFSAVRSETDKCNPWATSEAASNVTLILGATFTIIAVVYSTVSIANSVKHEDERQPLTSAKPLVDSDDEGTDGHKAINNGTESEDAMDNALPVPYNISVFHIFFMLGAFYLAMLMSDWATVDVRGHSYVAVDTGAGAVWVKVVSSWVCYVLYAWTLAAPAIWPDRDWGYTTDAAWSA